MNKEFSIISTDRVTMMIRIRWVTFICVLAIIIISLANGNMKFPLLPTIFLAAMVAIYFFSLSYLNRVWKDFSEKKIYTFIRCSIDIIAISFLVHITGGVNSSFTFLYLLDPVSACLFQGFGIGFLLVLEATFLYSLIVFLESYKLLLHYQTSALANFTYLDPSYLITSIAALFYSALAITFAVSYAGEHIRKKQEEINRLTDSKLDFVNTVIHELKSPLTSIIGYLSFILENLQEITADTQKKSLDIIDYQAKRLLKMVENLLSLARLESGKMPFEIKKIDLHDLIYHAIEEMTPQISQKNLKLTQNLSPDTKYVMADENRTLEVLINLLSNSIKFSEEGSNIIISTRKLEKEVEVSITDQGLGIEKEDLDRIFEKFYRSRKETQKYRGTGLGLNLSKNIIEHQKGKMWASSDGPGKGATFYFTLPLFSNP